MVFLLEYLQIGRDRGDTELDVGCVREPMESLTFVIKTSGRLRGDMTEHTALGVGARPCEWRGDQEGRALVRSEELAASK
jgi:hypothetical protein